MLRIFFGAAALALCAPAFACDGQTGKVIFEDKFTDDSGGWVFGDDNNLVLKAPGATLTIDASEKGGAQAPLNQTFTATQGDFCVEMSFPQDATRLDAHIGIIFLATDDKSYWVASVFSDGKVTLFKGANNQWSKIWDAVTNSVVKTSPMDVNTVRAVVKYGSIMVIVNGQTVKSVRANIPSGDFKFGFLAEHLKPSAIPVSFPVRSYRVTAVE